MATERWNIDTSHSNVEFVARHLVVTKVRGHFTKWSGHIDIDKDDITRSSAAATIEVASIDTREPQRDAHLKSPDFLDAEKFAQITFASKKVERDGRDSEDHRRPDDPRRHQGGHARGRAARHQQGSVGQHARALRGQDAHQPQGLRPDLEPGARDRRRAGEREDRDRDRGAGREGGVIDQPGGGSWASAASRHRTAMRTATPAST
ncbi:MAG: YceI family protein [Minicystis sp.]